MYLIDSSCLSNCFTCSAARSSRCHAAEGADGETTAPKSEDRHIEKGDELGTTGRSSSLPRRTSLNSVLSELLSPDDSARLSSFSLKMSIALNA